MIVIDHFDYNLYYDKNNFTWVFKVNKNNFCCVTYILFELGEVLVIQKVLFECIHSILQYQFFHVR